MSYARTAAPAAQENPPSPAGVLIPRRDTRIAELAGLGELAVARGNWNSYRRSDPVIPGGQDAGEGR